jgi:predicted Fe-S protein YdhL (DUF1289 family)
MIESPCVKICTLDESGELCMGCFRTIEEIGSWSQLGDPARMRVLELATGRRRSLGDAVPLAVRGAASFGESCGAEFMVSLNLLSDANVTDGSSTNRQIPAKCPSCPRDWSDIRKAVRDFGPSMEAMRQCEGLSFRVTMPSSERK